MSALLPAFWNRINNDDGHTGKTPDRIDGKNGRRPKKQEDQHVIFQEDLRKSIASIKYKIAKAYLMPSCSVARKNEEE